MCRHVLYDFDDMHIQGEVQQLITDLMAPRKYVLSLEGGNAQMLEGRRCVPFDLGAMLFNYDWGGGRKKDLKVEYLRLISNTF